MTKHTALEFLTAGDYEAELLQQYLSLEREDIYAGLRFAASLTEREFPFSKVT